MTQHFKYVSSWDELTWSFNESIDLHGINRCMIKWNMRPEIKEWINTCCDSEVLCWNGTSTPDLGMHDWQHIVSPHNERCYLFFTSKHDNSMFLLKYASELNVEHLGTDLVKAYQDSRKMI